MQFSHYYYHYYFISERVVLRTNEKIETRKYKRPRKMCVYAMEEKKHRSKMLRRAHKYLICF